MYSWSAILVLVVTTQATDVENCLSSDARRLQPNEVSISGCPERNCTWEHNTVVSIEMKIVPTRDFEELYSNTAGILFNVPLPFVGIDGTSACPHIYDEAGSEEVDCPLTGGKTYVYKNTFPILAIYPRVQLLVYWQLGDGKGDAACFEILATIV